MTTETQQVNDKLIIGDTTILIDPEDYHRLADLPWRKRGAGYFSAHISGDDVLLHRFILGIPLSAGRSVVVDHIDHNTLDCRKANLRKTDYTGNVQHRRKYHRVNSGKYPVSKYKGVTWHSAGNTWRCCITTRFGWIQLFASKCEEACAFGYNVAAKVAHKEFAVINEGIVLDDYTKCLVEAKTLYRLFRKYPQLVETPEKKV